MSLRYLENPDGDAARTLSFCEVRSLARPEVSSSAGALMLSEDAQYHRPEKTNQAL